MDTTVPGAPRSSEGLPDRAQVVVVGGGVDRHEHRLPPDEARLARRRPARAPPAHRRHDLARGRASSPRPAWPPRRSCGCPATPATCAPRSRPRPARRPASARSATSTWRRTPQRLETLRREAAFARGHGVDDQELSAAEFGRLWPAAKTDDVLAAFYVPDEGRVNPADLTMAYAKGARMGGARIVEGVTVTGVTTAQRPGHRRRDRPRARSRPSTS